MAGPLRWLLRRLDRHGRVLLWPASRGERIGGVFDLAHLDGLPELLRRLPQAGVRVEALGAIALDLSEAEDCRLLWRVARHVAEGSGDFFVGDPGCAEVYRLHHHAKVVASIPDEAARRECLRDLERWAGVIEDCSGYETDWDEGDE